jgi:hypothetical protein
MATDEAPAATSAAISALSRQVNGMRATVQGMHTELRQYPRKSGEYRAAVHEITAATTELIDAQGRLRQMRLARQRRLAAELVKRHLRRTERRLWLLIAVVAVAGGLVVLLAASGAIATSRLVIGVPLLLAAALMAASMSLRTARDAGPHALDLRKGVAAGVLAVLALLGALVWPVLGYACVLAVAVAAVPLLAAWQARQRRTVERDLRRG